MKFNINLKISLITKMKYTNKNIQYLIKKKKKNWKSLFIVNKGLKIDHT